MTGTMRWVTAHAAAQYEAVTLFAPKPTGKVVRFDITMPFHARRVRLVLCERYGEEPVIYDRALLCMGDKAWSVTFNGDAEAVLLPAQELKSDAVPAEASKGDIFTLWLFHAGKHSPRSFTVVPARYCKPEALYGKEPPFNDDQFKILSMLHGACCYARLEAETDDESACAVVAFGDSITAMGMWTEPFYKKLSEQNGPALLNMGINGNRLLLDTSMPLLKKTQFFGRAGLTRFPWDVAALPGVRAVIIALGVNDISQPGGKKHRSPHCSERCTAEALIAGFEKLIALCKEKNLKTMGCTITPFEGYLTHNDVTERIRSEVNDWILNDGAFDMTADFASAVCDPERPEHLFHAYDSGDHLHPSALGGKQMAESIDLLSLMNLTRI